MMQLFAGGMLVEKLIEFMEKIIGIANTAAPMTVAVLALLVALPVVWTKRRD